MALKFGIFDHLERLRDVPIDQQYRDRLKLVAKMEAYNARLARQQHKGVPMITESASELLMVVSRSFICSSP